VVMGDHGDAALVGIMVEEEESCGLLMMPNKMQ